MFGATDCGSFSSSSSLARNSLKVARSLGLVLLCSDSSAGLCCCCLYFLLRCLVRVIAVLFPLLLV